jgi:hypothetical protein
MMDKWHEIQDFKKEDPTLTLENSGDSTFARAPYMYGAWAIQYLKQEKGRDVWVIANAEERIRITDIKRNADSIFVGMPVFESDLKLKKVQQPSRNYSPTPLLFVKIKVVRKY